MYHRFVLGSGDSRRLGVEHFSAQLEYIARYHPVWTPDQHLASIKANQVSANCPVVVTIDDGYADFAEVAQPLLDKHGVPAILFVVTDFVSGKMWFWWDQLRFALYAADAGSYLLASGSTDYEFELNGKASRDLAWSDIATDFSRRKPADIQEQLDAVVRQLGVDLPVAAPDEYSALSWEQLQQAVSSNIILGAHTRTHPALSRVDDRTVAEEIDASRQEIIAQTGSCSSVFCYPHGQKEDYSVTTISIVDKLGFDGAYVAFEGGGMSQSVFELERYSVHDDWVDFRWKLCGAQYLLQRI
jgi:peptidoglycan/xylan/chitin deacetylase (PgdA/CDA1 family)